MRRKPHVEPLIHPAPLNKITEKFVPKVKKTLAPIKSETIETVFPSLKSMRIVEFSGDSRVTLGVPDDIEDYLEIVFTLNHQKNQGILFAWSDAKRYLVLTLESGFVNVHASMGFDAITLRSESVLSLHTWHKAEVWRSGKGILLKVDKQSWIESELHSVRSVGESSRGGVATVGGSNEATPSHLLPIHGFHGCMKRVVLNGHHIHLASQPSVGLRECGSDPCASGGCPSGCASRYDSFVVSVIGQPME
ncbi:unnamed protein product, partial [Mesorhabditis belari]|uniref:Laminin G domain-containing protein n=1 Tax=Mesorhabditis belari TaxID=2138241 RepID=A0AAF3J212_9BILA